MEVRDSPGIIKSKSCAVSAPKEHPLIYIKHRSEWEDTRRQDWAGPQACSHQLLSATCTFDWYELKTSAPTMPSVTDIASNTRGISLCAGWCLWRRRSTVLMIDIWCSDFLCCTIQNNKVCIRITRRFLQSVYVVCLWNKWFLQSSHVGKVKV